MPTIAACHAAISAGLQRAHVWSPLVVLPRLSSHSNLDKCSLCFLPRASERRVLPIVGVIFSSSHLLIFTSSLTPSHLHIFSSSHLLIFTSAPLHIFTSAHLHTFSSSHVLIFTSAPLHISSSHPLIFTPSHLHTFSHTFSSSHLLIFTSAHLHICSSSHLLIFTSAPLHIFSSSHLLSFLSPFSLSRLLYLSLFRPRVVPAGSHETSTLSHEMRVDRQKLR